MKYHKEYIQAMLDKESHLMSQATINKLRNQLADKELEEPEQCNVCKKIDEYQNMCMDLAEILECSNERQIEWENQNLNIDLYGWFCHSCATKHITEIEESDNDK